jgi:drug/metabolite transporter (DMT)-like permease
MQISLGIRSAARPITQTRWFANMMLLAITAIGSATYFMTKEAVSDFPILHFLTLRFAIGTIVLLPLVLKMRRGPTREELTWGLLAGGVLCAAYILQVYSLRIIDTGRNAFLVGLYVIGVPFLAAIFMRQKLTIHTIIGVGLALVGLIMLSYAAGNNLFGDLLALLSALAYAAQVIIVAKFPHRTDWRMMSILQAACMAVICGILSPLAGPLPTVISTYVWPAIAFTGVLATGVGLIVQVWAQKFTPPCDAALIFTMDSPFAVLLGVMILHEAVTMNSILGSVAILAGMLITVTSTQKR